MCNKYYNGTERQVNHLDFAVVKAVEKVISALHRPGVGANFGCFLCAQQLFVKKLQLQYDQLLDLICLRVQLSVERTTRR
jgi:hypothetical protein